MLIELPNGGWISPKAVAGVRVMVGDKLGPRVVIDTHRQDGHHLIEFDAPEAARLWASEFGGKCAGGRDSGALTPRDAARDAAEAMNEATGLSTCHTGNGADLIAALRARGWAIVPASE